MTLNWNTNTLFSYKSLVLGLILSFLAIVLFCGFAETIDHPFSTEDIECNYLVQLINYTPIKDKIPLSILLLLFVGLMLLKLIKYTISNRRRSASDFYLQFVLIKKIQIFPKLYNPILKALRKGILHPQIYNLAVVR